MNFGLRNRNVDLDDLATFGAFARFGALPQLSRFFESGFDGEGLFDEALAPAIDLSESEDGYTLIVDLPGVDKKDLELSVENNVLTLKGEKKESTEPRKVFRRETWTGEFRRTISLPQAADSQKVQAELKDGVLTVSIGKKPELKPRQIAVSVR